MTAVARLADRLTALLMAVASLTVIVMMLHVCLDVGLRLAEMPAIPATVEIVSNYYMVGLAFLPIAFVERKEAMISVELIDGLLSPGLRRVSDLLIALLSVALYGLIAYASWDVAIRNYANGAFVMALGTPVPIWPAYFGPPIGFGLAALATLLRAALLILAAAPAAKRPTPTFDPGDDP